MGVAILAAAARGAVGREDMKPDLFLNQLQRDAIVAAIREAELKTSGEIRVFITQHHVETPVSAAQAQFSALGMGQTRERNGVLLFVAPGSQKFAIIGDAGVHTRCGDEFWIQVASELTDHFKKSEFSKGIIHAIRKAGDLLAEHFPRRPDDRNELSDEIAHD